MMGWFDVIWKAGVIGVEVASYSKLAEMQRQGADAIAIQALLKIFRDEIFSYKQIAENILSAENQSPRIAAAGMIILKNKIEKTHLSPELFPDLADKDYVANTFRLIRNETNRLIGSLPPQDAAEVREVVYIAESFEDEQFLVNNYEKGTSVRSAIKTCDELGDRNTKGTGWGLGCGGIIAALLLSVWTMTMQQPQRNSVSTFGLMVIGALIVLILVWKKPFVYKSSLEDRNRLSKEIDIDHFIRAYDKYSGNLSLAMETMASHKTLLDKFFNGETIIHDGKSVDKPSMLSAEISQTIEPDPGVLVNTISEPSENIRETRNEGVLIDKDVIYKEEPPGKSIPQQENKYCMYCGCKLPGEALYCPSCGKKQ
jgi:hypothetical protein